MKKIFIFFCSMLSLIIMLASCANTHDHSSLKVLSEEQMLKGIDIIVQEHTDKYSKSHIATDIDDIPEKWVALSKNEKENYNYHISISFYSSFFPKKEPVQVYGMFECFLWLNSEGYIDKPFGIMWDYSNGGIDGGGYKLTFIRTSEFEELYKTVDISGLSRKDAARKLGDQWMKETGYVIDWSTKW